MKSVKSKSPAKINLTLEIIQKLSNGFHSLRSVVMKLEKLSDEIEIIFNDKKRRIKIVCDDKKIPTDEKNICWKSAEKFFEASGKKVGIEIKIKKKIPALAGLGGGSSNGAMVFLALNKYFGYPLSSKSLVKIAAEIGKDIPIFLSEAGAVFMGGTGEKILPVKNFPKLHVLLINPRGEIGTGWAYGELDKKTWFMDDKRRKNISRRMLKGAKNSEKIASLLYNDFSLVAEEKFPVIGEIKNFLLAFGSLGVSITGKGPTVFGIFKSRKEAIFAKKLLKKKYPDFFVELA
jgi:4-diphosphocytidyl-2-C-methyl-D-erythritol kinase